MQHEIKTAGPLLKADGSLREAGFARSLILDYDRAAIKAGASRIKEWDYYLIYDNEVAVALTIDDNSYMNMVSASYIDLKKAKEKTTSFIRPLTWGKTGLPASSKQGHIHYEDKNSQLDFKVEDGKRFLKLWIANFEDGKPFECDLVLEDEPQDSMVIATPFPGKPKHFYYNQKIIGMRASGVVACPRGGHVFKSETAFGLLDWGRGVWTYKNTWYWGAAQGLWKDHVLGFNIGYGFGDTRAASENMLFFDGVAHKLDKVTFNIPKDGRGKDDFMKPWTFTSNDGRFTMHFQPIIDRAACTNALVIKSDQHQVFGWFTGSMMLDDGTRVEIEKFLGFAEKVANRW
ncbi:MAG: DUF2804 domain-containing protein [Coriobacteriales bacterium]|nr:DUF2804 domain-containing protein [Coriobacteriales bacterium]